MKLRKLTNYKKKKKRKRKKKSYKKAKTAVRNRISEFS